jgi:hypothetical protein
MLAQLLLMLLPALAAGLPARPLPALLSAAAATGVMSIRHTMQRQDVGIMRAAPAVLHIAAPSLLAQPPAACSGPAAPTAAHGQPAAAAACAQPAATHGPAGPALSAS